MAINFPNSPSDGQQLTEGSVTYTYNATKGYWESTESSSGSSSSTTVVADMAALIALTGMSDGDQALVQATNKLYMYSGTGWYLIATIQNDAPSAITGVAGSYQLAIDGTATTITAASTDPEGFPLTWSYSTSGLGSIATVSNTDGVFTITPSTTEADAGTFTLTINATDGVNGAVSTSTNLTLEFIVIVTNSNYTTLLATATGTSDNNNITDAAGMISGSITVSGDAHTGTFSPYRSGGYSTYFDGSSGGLQIAGDSSIAIHTDFTIECWFYLDNNTNSTQAIFSCDTGISSNGLCVQNNNGTSLILRYGGSSKLVDASNVFELERWYHIALTYDQSASTLTLYIDGQQYYQNTSISLGNTNTSYLTIGALGAGFTGYSHVGYIRDFRFSSEVVYSSNFSNPTEPLSNTSATEVLTCHLPYISDASTNNHSITQNSTVSTKPFSPYDYLEYSSTDHGGSINFDGSGDYLTIPDHSAFHFASNDWTIECWIYPRTNVGDCGIWHQSASGTDWYSIYLDGAFNLKFVFYNSSNGVEWAGTAASNTAPQNTWTHVALVRQFGTGVYLYANGKLVASDTLDASVTMLDKTYNHVIGYERFVGSGTYFDGFISDFKMDIGTAHYTAEFTPPTAPLSSSGSELHIKGTDASIIDKSQVNNLKLIGGPTGSTTQAKFSNTKSIDFGDGSLLYVMEVPSGAGYTGEFTIEFWMYNTNVTSTWQALISNSYVNGSEYFRLYKNNGSGAFALYHNSTSARLTGIGSIANNTWTHVAVVRDSSNNITVYQDGSSIGSYNNNTVFGTASNPINVGKGGVGDTTNYPMSGYIQDLRITEGLARYTANFTPPTASLEG